jgi:chromosome segregation ATPase
MSWIDELKSNRKLLDEIYDLGDKVRGLEIKVKSHARDNYEHRQQIEHLNEEIQERDDLIKTLNIRIENLQDQLNGKAPRHNTTTFNPEWDKMVEKRINGN